MNFRTFGAFTISTSAILDEPVAQLEDAPPAPQPALRPGAVPEVTVRKPGLPALTGLRTVLAVNIMLFHFTPPHIGFLAPLINNAYVFVGFFFLISGFVLAYNYADRPVLSRRRFYIARLSRVYPVYLLVLLLSLPLLRQEWQAHPPSDFYRGLLLTPLALQGWSPKLATFWNTVAWTLPAELMLYTLFPFLLIAIAAQGKRLATPGRIALAILAVWTIGITPHVCYLLFNPDHLPAPADRYSYGYWLGVIKYTPPAYLCTFTAGVLLARLHAALRLTEKLRSAMALGALAGLGLFFGLAVDRVPYVLVHGALLLPLFALLLLGLAGPGPVASVLSWKPLVLFGETTFALYLLHFNAFVMIHSYHVPEFFHVAQFDPWVSYAAIVALAFVVHRFYEQPARRMVLGLANQSQSTL